MSKVRQYSEYKFGIVDYIIFVLMILGSTMVGIFLAYKKEKANVDESGKTKVVMEEFLLGSRKMKVFPVAMSLVASYVSGVTILGTPTEVYNYGAQYSIIFISIGISSFLIALIYMPVFMKIRITSSYEYLELRFHPYIRTIASVMFVYDEILFLPIVIYVPALVFTQVSGTNIYVVGFIVTAVTVVYTLLGGMKAVVYTEAWQTYVMFISAVVVFVLGTIDIGGPGEACRKAHEAGRLFWNTNASLYNRGSIFAVLTGGTAYWLAFNSVNQTMVQRYISMSTLGKARWSIAIFAVGIGSFIGMICFCGILITAVFRYCDPKTADYVTADDQMFALYVMHVTGWLIGVPGLFIAGIFGAALSSLSVILHSTASVIQQDLINGFMKCELSDGEEAVIVKLSVVITGIIGYLLMFVVDKADNILGVATTLTSIAASVSFGMFTLGMLVPWSNAKGAAIGGIASAIITSWIALGSEIVVAKGRFRHPILPIDVSECPHNVTMPEVEALDTSNVLPLYRLAYFWVNPIGILVVVTVGALSSLFLRGTPAHEINADLFSPIIHRFLPEACFENSISENPRKRT